MSAAVWGIADVTIAVVLSILSMALVGRWERHITPDAIAFSYRVHRALAHAILVLLVVFFLVGDRVAWGTVVPGFAWRTWLLVHVLPAWYAARTHSRPRALDAPRHSEHDPGSRP